MPNPNSSIVYFDQEATHQLQCDILDLEDKMRKARQPETKEKYQNQRDRLLAALGAYPKGPNPLFLKQVLESFKSHVSILEKSIEQEKEVFKKDPVHFIESLSASHIGHHCELRCTVRLIRVIEERMTVERRHWIVWLNEVWDLWEKDFQDDIYQRVDCLFNCTSIFVNAVDMVKLQSARDFVKHGALSQFRHEIREAKKWASQNMPQILTNEYPVMWGIEGIEQKASTECAPAQARV